LVGQGLVGDHRASPFFFLNRDFDAARMRRAPLVVNVENFAQRYAVRGRLALHSNLLGSVYEDELQF
jgi:hypothetical protein